MFKYIPKFSLLAASSILIVQTALPTEANPKKPQQAQSQTEAIYQKAKKELPEDWYVIYRIAERIARANGVDNSPWRVVVVPEYNINAFATDVNLVAIYSGIIDQLAGDSSAIACIVGHEIGHHVKRHIAMGEAEQAAIQEQIRKEAEAEVLAEAEDAQSDATGSAIGGGIFRGIGGIFGGIGGDIGNTGGAILENASQQRIADAQERIQEIVALKQAQLEQRLAENNRRQEFEADEIGYLYMAKAGFEPSGCLRAMGVLARTSGAEFDTNHPAVPKRIERLNELMTQYPPTTLAQEGKTQLATNNKPLTYDLSRDGQSLRINSRRGGSTADDIDRLLR